MPCHVLNTGTLMMLPAAALVVATPQPLPGLKKDEDEDDGDPAAPLQQGERRRPARPCGPLRSWCEAFTASVYTAAATYPLISVAWCWTWPRRLARSLVSLLLLRRDLGLVLPRVSSILMLLRPFYVSGLQYSKYLPNTSNKEFTYTTLDTLRYPKYLQSKSTLRETAAWYRTSRSNLHEIRTQHRRYYRMTFR